jgi:hypothetical protein
MTGLDPVIFLSVRQLSHPPYNSYMMVDMTIMDWIMSLAAVALLGVVVRGFWKADKTKPSDKQVNPAQDRFQGGGPHA